MSYQLEALIASESFLKKLKHIFPQVQLLALPQGFFMVPLNEFTYTAITHESKKSYDPDEQGSLWGTPHQEIINLVKKISSVNEKVAHLEIECFGGEGYHAGCAWNEGELILPSYYTTPDLEDSLALSDLPSNKALKSIGVVVTEVDEFWSLKLYEKRNTDDW